MKLNAQLLSLALLSLSGTAAMSQEAVNDLSGPIVSTVARVDVRQAAIDALRDGSLPRGEASYVEPPILLHSTLTRAQVSAEAKEAMRLGLVAYGEGVARQATPGEIEQIRLAGWRATQGIEMHAAK